MEGGRLHREGWSGRGANLRGAGLCRRENLIKRAEVPGRLICAVCSDEGLTLETSAKHHIPQATNIPYQPR